MYIWYQIYSTLNKSKNNIKYICVTKYGVRTIEAKKFSDAIQEAYDISGYDDVLIMIIENDVSHFNGKTRCIINDFFNGISLR